MFAPIYYCFVSRKNNNKGLSSGMTAARDDCSDSLVVWPLSFEAVEKFPYFNQIGLLGVTREWKLRGPGPRTDNFHYK